jgi:hypothetical protein
MIASDWGVAPAISSDPIDHDVQFHAGIYQAPCKLMHAGIVDRMTAKNVIHVISRAYCLSVTQRYVSRKRNMSRKKDAKHSLPVVN